MTLMMVGWRRGGGARRPAPDPPGPPGRSASSRLFTQHFGSRWQPDLEPSTAVFTADHTGSNRSLNHASPPLSMVPNGQYVPPPGGSRYMDGPVFSSPYQPSPKRSSDYGLDDHTSIHPPRGNNQNGHATNLQDSKLISNGYARPKKKKKAPGPPVFPQKRRAPEPPGFSETPPPIPYPLEPAADYEGYGAPPVAPKPPPILPSSVVSAGSSRRSVPIQDELEYIERSEHDRPFSDLEFKEELQKKSLERAQKGNIEPPPRPEMPPAEVFLNQELKEELIKAAELRAQRPFEEPVLNTRHSTLGHVLEDDDDEDEEKQYPALSEEIQEELKEEFEKYTERRRVGSLRMRKNDKNKVLYTALPATSVGTAIKEDTSKDWVPEQDLVDDVLDGPVTLHEHTSRNAPMPTFFPVFQENTSEMSSVLGQNAKKPSSKQGGGKKGRKIKESFKNAWGSLRRSIGRKSKLRDILNDPQWEIYHTENYDPAPEGPISIHHIETKPAYAYNPHKTQLMLIPNFDKVIVTTDGKYIREDTLTKVAKLGAESSHHSDILNTDGMKPDEVKREMERREQMRAEIQFQIVRRQISASSDDVFAEPTAPGSTLEQLVKRRDSALRSNPIYDSDEDVEESVSGRSAESLQEPDPKKRTRTREDRGRNETPHAAMFPGFAGVPQMVPVMMYPPGQTSAQQPLVQYVMPMIPQQAAPPTVQPTVGVQHNFAAFAPGLQPSTSAGGVAENVAFQHQIASTITSPSSNVPTVSTASPPVGFRPINFQPLPKQPRPPTPSAADHSPLFEIPPAPPPPPILGSAQNPQAALTPSSFNHISEETRGSDQDEPQDQPSEPDADPLAEGPSQSVDEEHPPEIEEADDFEPPPAPAPVPTSTPNIEPWSASVVPRPSSPIRSVPFNAPGSTSLSPGVPFSQSSQQDSAPTGPPLVPDKEMPDFYRRDFYRKLLQGPIGWKPVSFQPGVQTAAKDRYLVDSDFDTNRTVQVGDSKNVEQSARPAPGPLQDSDGPATSEELAETPEETPKVSTEENRNNEEDEAIEAEE